MLRDGDLVLFSKRFSAAERRSDIPSTLDEVLRVDSGGLFRAEIGRLSRSLQLANVVGDVSRGEAAAASLIVEHLPEDMRIASLDNADAWERAIAWSMAQSGFVNSEGGGWYARQQQVGAACARLRKQRYRIDIGAYGPEMPIAPRREISAVIEGLVRLIGGVEVAQQLCRVLRDTDRFHDGMWLFGDCVPSVMQTGRPALPYGWLFSLAMKHAGHRGTARKPEKAWETLIALASDTAAVFDCQRYGQFEEINIAPSEAHRAIRDSLVWREIFTLPQVPPLVVSRLQKAFSEVLTSEDKICLDVSIDGLINEIETALAHSVDDRLTIHRRDQVERASPLLWQLARGQNGQVNKSYLDPLSLDQRNHDGLIFFEVGVERLVTGPRSMIAAAGCDIIFRRIWSKLPRKRAEAVVGSVLERTLEKACHGKAPVVISREKYTVGKEKFEIDVATRDNDKIVLIEVKAKSLTAKARSGDAFSFFADYAASYLALLEQLARHEVHLKAGAMPLIDANEELSNIRPAKVAVSPLSYGPISDKVLSSTLVMAFARIQLNSLIEEPKEMRAVNDFNAAVADALTQIAIVAPKCDGLVDLFPYLIDVFWMDLGQVLYTVDRAYSTWSAFEPLKYITFSTRDFWTEVAFVDRQGLTAGKWRPVASHQKTEPTSHT